MSQTTELDKIIEGARSITTEDVLHFDSFDIKYLKGRICQNPHFGSFFLRIVMERIDRWGEKFSRCLYDKKSIEPTVTLDTLVLTAICWVCFFLLSVLAGFTPNLPVRIFCYAMMLACAGAVIWMQSHGPQGLEVVYKDHTYGKVIFKQEYVKLSATNQIIPYADLTLCALDGRHLLLVTRYSMTTISFLPDAKDIYCLYKYILVRSGLSEQQDRCGDADKA